MDEILKNLNKKGFIARTFDNIDEVKKVILEEIDPKQTVGIGGSITVKESGLYDLLKERGNTVYFHWEVEKDKVSEIRKLAHNADIYISSSNAVTEDGKLVNIDSTGNRVASMFYGPDKVYIICGRNKIVKNEEEAVNRVKTVACVKNAERLNRNTPCRKTGECHDCNVKDRMCSVKVVVEYPPSGKDIHILLVNEDIGY